VWNVVELVRSIGKKPVFVANQEVPTSVGIDDFETIDSLPEYTQTIPFFTGVVRPASKKFVVEQAESFGLRFREQLISDVASVSFGVELGVGVIIRQFVLVDPLATVANHVTLSPGVTVGHHTTIGSFSHLANGVTVSGGVDIGEQVFVGVGASIRDGISIGAGATVGMGAVVVRDVKPGAIVVGNPAKVLG
jgi:sugar O-acyltransferase (sialic acid O-acetyltransferase NeuD family)